MSNEQCMTDFYIFIHKIQSYPPLFYWSQPYFTTEKDIIGDKKIYTREDIIKLSNIYPKTSKKRILSLKPGNCYKLYQTGRNSTFYLKRLNDEQYLYIKNCMDLNDTVSTIEKEIYSRTKDLEDILREKRKDIEKLEEKIAAEILEIK